MVDVELYGGRRGYLQHLHARVLYALGAYRPLEKIQWASITRLVFVCHGNICRSPYAAARARALGLNAISYGLNASDGMCANEAANRAAWARGINLTAHLSARISESVVTRTDLVFVFEPRQLRYVTRQTAGKPGSVSLIGVWSRPLHPYIQDPYGRSARYFEQCFSIIDENLQQILRRLASSGSAALERATHKHT